MGDIPNGSFRELMLKALDLRSQNKTDEARPLLERAEGLIRSDEERADWYAEKAMQLMTQLIARYGSELNALRKASLEEYEQVLHNLEQHKKIVGSEESMSDNMHKFYTLVKGACSVKKTESKPSAKSGPCFVATAVYGSPMAREVQTLRDYRDEILARTGCGRAFICVYERVGPWLARLIENRPFARRIIRQVILNPLILLIRHDRRGFQSSLFKNGDSRRR